MGKDLRIAVLCPGPSLARVDDSEIRNYHLAIGVNGAVEKVYCSHWAFGDFNIFETLTPKGCPINFTSESTAYFLCNNEPKEIANRFKQMDFISWESVSKEMPAEHQPIFSACAALLLAYSLKAEKIDVYGADWKGTRDFAGKETGYNRTETRWEIEQKRWDWLVNWLGHQGTRVERRYGNFYI